MLTSADAGTAESFVRQHVASLGTTVVRRVAYIDEPDRAAIAPQLTAALDHLLADGVLTEVIYLDYDPAMLRSTFVWAYGEEVVQKIEQEPQGDAAVGVERVAHWEVHARGYYARLWTLFDCSTEFCVHLDADIAIHSQNNYSWIEEGGKILGGNDDVFVVSPKSGAPEHDLVIKKEAQPLSNFVLDTRGFWRFDAVTSRYFIFMRRKVEAQLPFVFLPGHVEDVLTHTMKMRGLKYPRADLMSGKAWAIHVPGDDHFKLAVNDCVSKGTFPARQEGEFNAIASAFWTNGCKELPPDQQP